MADIIPWIATIATIIGASLTASNLGSRVTGYGFVVLAFGALCWITAGVLNHEPALMWTNIILIILDSFGIWRWLGRQAGMEEGAHVAAEQSEGAPGETLFPISLLTRAPVVAEGRTLARLVEGMAGSSSGRLHYVVISQGGVGGVGETLHRLPWSSATMMEGDAMVTRLSSEDLQSLDVLERDRWPAR